MFRYSFSILLILFSIKAGAQQDSVHSISAVQPKQKQIRVGIDASRIVMNSVFKNRNSYAFMLDYSLPKEVYLVAEGGFGGSDIDYPDLKYSSNNSFFKIGVDRSMLQRQSSSDWDFLFVGIRYGVAFINRSEANFVTNDNFWGSTSGTIPAKTFTGHWAELTTGLRVELLKGFFAGYNVRGKFLLNQGPFRELPPAYVAGYGKGEKNTVFDFNFYLQYAIRW